MIKILLPLALLAAAPATHAAVYSTVEASSDSGGNSVGPGGTIVTGSESASTYSTTIERAGSASVRIRTDINGTVHEQVPGDANRVQVSVWAAPEAFATTVTTSSIQSTPKKSVPIPLPPPVVKKVVPTPAAPYVGSASTSTVAATVAPAMPVVPEPQSIIAQVTAALSWLFSWWR